MAKRKVRRVSKKTKRKTFNKKRFKKNTIKLIELGIIILFFSFAVFALNKIINSNNKLITLTSDNITYYINIADNNSKAKKQLNWQEIASIEGATCKKFDTYNEEETSKIAQAFYNDNGKIDSISEVISSLNLTSKQKTSTYKNLDQIKNICDRTVTLGKDTSKDEFVEAFRSVSIENYKKYGVLPSITIGQAILESDWGTSELASKYNNYFGIKADKSWKGEIANFTTKENYNDVIKANFRAYSSISASIDDQGNFLTQNSRYTKFGVFIANNYSEQAQALENAGYSTVKDKVGNLIYADLLVSIIKENNLMIMDNEAEK